MKSKPRVSKAAPKPAKKAAASKAPAKKKPAGKAVSRGPRAAKAPKRTTAAKRTSTAKKAPARKARATKTVRRTAAVSTKKPVRARTKSRPAARTPRSNGRVPQVREFTKREAWATFDLAARTRTGMTGKEFIEWWNRGEFEKDPDEIPGVMSVAMLLPLVEGW